MAKTGVKIKIFGQVQGVNFRYYLYQLARQMGLAGWVRNTEDGGVECRAEGEKEELAKLIHWCEKGPALAEVSGVEVEYKEVGGKFKDFKIIY